MTGVIAVLAYSKFMFTHAGLDSQMAQFASIGVGLCNFLSPLITMFLVERAGRKAILLFGLALSDAALIALTICIAGSQVYHWPGAAIGAIPCIYILQVGFALSNSIFLIAAPELFPQNARAKAMTVVFTVWWSLQTIILLGYLSFSEAVGAQYSYLPFIACVTVIGVLLIFLLPETKGKSAEEVAALFSRRSGDDASDQRHLIVQ